MNAERLPHTTIPASAPAAIVSRSVITSRRASSLVRQSELTSTPPRITHEPLSEMKTMSSAMSANWSSSV